jgi:shikimate dehydrogenase
MNDDKIKAGVIGWPIDHSLSPRLYRYWLEKYTISGSYNAFAVEEIAISQLLENIAGEGFAGLNVTVPHKQVVLEYLDVLSDSARKIGAVNTITVQTDGILFGDNTDGFGFLENVKHNYAGFNVTAGPSVVIGAGGAARAIVAALVNAGAPTIKVVNRTRSNAEKLAEDIGGPIEVLDWGERHGAMAGANFVTNATTLGMVGKPPLELSLGALPTNALVNDIVYAPLETQLLKNAKNKGNPSVDGIGMLLHQARPGFTSWFGVEPEVTDDLRRHVLASSGS